MPRTPTLKTIKKRRVVHKSTGGTFNSIPEPVDPVGNAPSTPHHTVALPLDRERDRIRVSPSCISHFSAIKSCHGAGERIGLDEARTRVCMSGLRRRRHFQIALPYESRLPCLRCRLLERPGRVARRDVSRLRRRHRCVRHFLGHSGLDHRPVGRLSVDDYFGSRRGQRPRVLSVHAQCLDGAGVYFRRNRAATLEVSAWRARLTFSS
jgi:hypothetical protein